MSAGRHESGAIRAGRRAAGQAGFTLIELMVVVAMVAIMSSVAMVSMKEPQDPGHVATRLATRVRECGRLAVAGGPVRDDVMTALGSRARARLAIRYLGDGSQEVAVERLEEEAEPSTDASWVQVSRSTITGSIRVTGYSDTTTLTAGLGPDTSFTSGEVDLACYPDGTTDGKTFYLDWSGSSSDRAHLAVLPMTGEPLVLSGW